MEPVGITNACTRLVVPNKQQDNSDGPLGDKSALRFVTVRLDYRRRLFFGHDYGRFDLAQGPQTTILTGIPAILF